MLNLILVFVYLFFGVSLQRFTFLPGNTVHMMNKYLIYVVLPAIAIRHIPAITLSIELILPVVTVWVFFLAAWVIIEGIGRLSKWDKATIGCLVLTVGLSNTSFLGFPIIDALYGKEGLKIALLVDQPGSFLLVSSLAIIVAAIYGENRLRKRDITKKIFKFPPFLFFILSLVMNIFNFEVGGMLKGLLDLIALTLTPIALIAVGLQIKIKGKDLIQPPLIVGLGLSLVIAPGLVYVFLGFFLDFQDLIFQVTVMEMAMPPMITASIIAVTYHLKPKLASLMVGVGIPLSMITLLIWYWILQ
ncbi:AEC family transporter [Anditalea andensis]|uniref:Transporter n=1 Tax=Anditalea andensis TaxID=1048983 RepID=A0A074L7C7_9BACT|nr:AEC family transporter [Anditalea andensis]KEO75753.1 transporter [Anditalea andensis]